MLVRLTQLNKREEGLPVTSSMPESGAFVVAWTYEGRLFARRVEWYAGRLHWSPTPADCSFQEARLMPWCIIVGYLTLGADDVDYHTSSGRQLSLK